MSKTQNSGHSFEKHLLTTLAAYESGNVATIEKVDPPTKVIGGQVVFMKNPYLDYVGVWTANGGRMVMVELKATTTTDAGDRLGILAPKQKGSGIKYTQLVAAKRWQAAGAAVCYLWARGDFVRFFTPAMVSAAAIDMKSIHWHETHRVPQGRGFVLVDFLAMLAPLTPGYTPTTFPDDA